jgi:hypothetical protein
MLYLGDDELQLGGTQVLVLDMIQRQRRDRRLTHLT